MPELPSSERWRLAKRALLGSLIVVVATAAAVATAALMEVGKAATLIGHNHIQVPAVQPVAPGSPQTLLLVGDDRRPPPKGRPTQAVVPHSNEMLLVRLDPSKPTISMLSIPRDLQVTILPHNGPATVNRINVAYTLGGINLMTETIKRVLGISVQHVVVITFPRFKQAVDQMGCVYSTVDRRYFHSNVGAPASEQYFEVNLQPGYQKLCGTKALEFVAYRHGDTAIIRDARDQRFLLDAKAEYGPGLVDNRGKFEQIFGHAVETDIHGTRQVLDLLQLLIQMAGRPVRQVHFNATLGARAVTATPAQIHQSVEQFLHGVAPIPQSHITATVRSARHHHRASTLSLVRTPLSDLRRARVTARGLPFALEYPRVRNQSGSPEPDSLRVYGVRDLQGHVHVAYTAVISRGRIGEYYDVQGSGWLNPPLLDNPTQTVHIGSRTYGLYYEGSNLHIVAWREGPAVYWIENTLIDGIPPREMLAMAEQTSPVGARGTLTRGETQPHNFVLPKRQSVKSPFNRLTTIGALLGFAALIGIALFAMKLFSRARELRELRARWEMAHRRSGPPRGRPPTPRLPPRPPVRPRPVPPGGRPPVPAGHPGARPQVPVGHPGARPAAPAGSPGARPQVPAGQPGARPAAPATPATAPGAAPSRPAPPGPARPAPAAPGSPSAPGSPGSPGAPGSALPEPASPRPATPPSRPPGPHPPEPAPVPTRRAAGGPGSPPARPPSERESGSSNAADPPVPAPGPLGRAPEGR